MPEAATEPDRRVALDHFWEALVGAADYEAIYRHNLDGVLLTEDAARIAERIRHELVMDPTAPSGLSFSIGVTERTPGEERSLDALVEAADRDMYQQRMLRRLRAARTSPS